MRYDPRIQKDHIKHIVKSNFVSMQIINMSAYTQSQISTISAQTGFYESHMVLIRLGSIRCLWISSRLANSKAKHEKTYLTIFPSHSSVISFSNLLLSTYILSHSVFMLFGSLAIWSSWVYPIIHDRTICVDRKSGVHSIYSWSWPPTITISSGRTLMGLELEMELTLT